MTKISFSFVFLISILSIIILLQTQNCRAASLSRRHNNFPANDTFSSAAAAADTTTAACDSDHRFLIADVVGTDSVDSDPRFASTLASNSLPITTKTLTPNGPSVSCPTSNGRYTSCLGDRKTVAPGSAVCRDTYQRGCYGKS